jgi:hypothetical protein
VLDKTPPQIKMFHGLGEIPDSSSQLLNSFIDEAKARSTPCSAPGCHAACNGQLLSHRMGVSAPLNADRRRWLR